MLLEKFEKRIAQFLENIMKYKYSIILVLLFFVILFSNIGLHPDNTKEQVVYRNIFGIKKFDLFTHEESNRLALEAFGYSPYYLENNRIDGGEFDNQGKALVFISTEGFYINKKGLITQDANMSRPMSPEEEQKYKQLNDAAERQMKGLPPDPNNPYSEYTVSD